MPIFKFAASAFVLGVLVTVAQAKDCTVTKGQFAGRTGTYTQDKNIHGEPEGAPSCDFDNGKNTHVSVDCGTDRCADGKQKAIKTNTSATKQQTSGAKTNKSTVAGGTKPVQPTQT